MVYDALFQAASATLQELAHRRVKATLGITSVLHTWTRELHLPPHVHAIVSAGGLTEAGWKSMSLKYLFDVKVMGTMLRGKMLTLLREAHQAGKLPATSAELAQLLLRLKRHNWGVYVKKVSATPSTYSNTWADIRTGLRSPTVVSSPSLSMRSPSAPRTVKSPRCRPSDFCAAFCSRWCPKAFRRSGTTVSMQVRPTPSSSGRAARCSAQAPSKRDSTPRGFNPGATHSDI